MPNEIRQKRVTGLLQEELASIIPGELDDPTLSLVSVIDVVVSKDLKNVRVYVNHQDENVSRRDVVTHLNKAMPIIRAKIGERLTTRVVPEITFSYDDTQARGSRLDEIFAQIKAEEATKTTPTTGENS